MTEFWHMFLQDTMTQKGNDRSVYGREDIILHGGRQDARAYQDNFAQTNPVAMLLHLQKAGYEQQMQNMYQQIHALNGQVAYLLQLLQQNPFLYGGQFSGLQVPQFWYPWTSYSPLPHYHSQPHYEIGYQSKDPLEMMTENFEKAARLRNAMNIYRNVT